MLEVDQNENGNGTLGHSIISQSVPSRVAPLNASGWADYKWVSISGVTVNCERKTWGEVLANIDSVEDQLRRHKVNQPQAKLVFLLEGWVEEHVGGTCVIQQANKTGIWVKGRVSGTTLSRVYAWLYNISEYVEVYQTGNYNQTCQWLVAAYKQDQKPSDAKQTFHRYYKEITFHADPQVLQLMGLMPGLGEVRAQALIEKFTTTWQVLSASPTELSQVPGIGPKLSVSLLRSIGRTDC